MCLFWGKDLVKGTSMVSVQVVLHQTNAMGMWILLSQCFHEAGILFLGAMPEDAHHAPPTERFDGQQNAARAVTSIFIVLLAW